MKKFIIAGGGTGGHIYPALSIAQAIQKIDPSVQITFVGSPFGLEVKIVPQFHFPLKLISIGKLNMTGQWLTKIKTLLGIPRAFFQSMQILRQEKPSYVLGVGGYASGPMVLMASVLGYRTGLWEANAFPGMANRILGMFVDDCFLVFKEAQKFFATSKVQVFGMPIRHEIEKHAMIQRKKTIEPGRKINVFCFGGSQGSRVINQTLFAMLKENKDYWKSKINLVHQIGATDYSVMKAQYVGYEDFVEVKEFIYDMPKYYEWADLILCRGGASTLAEVAAFQVPPLIIPLPAADGHQEKNAQSFQDHEAGVMILQKDLSPQVLEEKLKELLQSPKKIEEMSLHLNELFQLNASQHIAEALLKGTRFLFP